MNSGNNETESREIREFVNSLGLEQDVTAEQYGLAIKAAIKDRALIYYCIWKKLQQLHPEIDATKVMREASWDYGVVKGKRTAKKIGGTDKSPKEILKGQTAKGGMLAFKQEITELNDNRAVKVFHDCPHIETFKELGATAEEVKILCRDMLCWGDFGSFAPFPKVQLEWPSTLADGDGKGCELTLVKKP